MLRKRVRRRGADRASRPFSQQSACSNFATMAWLIDAEIQASLRYMVEYQPPRKKHSSQCPRTSCMIEKSGGLAPQLGRPVAQVVVLRRNKLDDHHAIRLLEKQAPITPIQSLFHSSVGLSARWLGS